ncbi:MAG TPA: TIM barrel protein [Candidatus Nanoarchaeia archaeon]|nr:TIM barrel protein [Candidatus Nanoarchaeia archaeon]
MRVLFGPGGTEGLGYPEGFRRCQELGLTALEVEFTHSVHMTNQSAADAGALARQHGISLSIHAPYFINLASAEKEKVAASKKRILDSCERGHHLGATCVVFHAAYYGKMDRGEVYSAVKREVLDMQRTIQKNKWNIALAPETTGKGAQFGDIDELLRLSQETGCGICVDFAHLLARTGKRDYDAIFAKLRPVRHIHAHFSGIEYTDKGERRHLVTPLSEIKELLSFIRKYQKDATIICESPEPMSDSVKMLRAWK